MDSGRDTIAAVATPPGRGGIAVIRISGARTKSIARHLVGKLPEPRIATLGTFKDEAGETLDSGLALYFPAPNSFTGEDILELHGHGGAVVVDLLLTRIMALGARLAGPGEFSERAFLNNKIDLLQAEAIADLIDSASEAAARSAMRSLSGEFSDELHRIVEELVALRTYVESVLDFPDEETGDFSDECLASRVHALSDRLARLVAHARQGTLLRDGVKVVLLGPPNAGKSSLLNALAQTNRAIVSPTPGTTRDTVELTIQLDGLPVYLVDTAGLHATEEAIEQEGARRAHEAVRDADLAVVVVEDGAPSGAHNHISDIPPNVRSVIVRNKIDLTGRPAAWWADTNPVELHVSVKTGEGLSQLKELLKTTMGFQSAGEVPYIARRRHLQAIGEARHHFQRALAALDDGSRGDLVAEELRLAQRRLGEITGEFTPDDLLGRIFSEFCIGK